MSGNHMEVGILRSHIADLQDVIKQLTERSKAVSQKNAHLNEKILKMSRDCAALAGEVSDLRAALAEKWAGNLEVVAAAPEATLVDVIDEAAETPAPAGSPRKLLVMHAGRTSA